MGERRARVARGQEEERAEHKPRPRSRWLVLRPFLFLPPPIRPSRARCAVLVAMSLFYGFFVLHSIRSLL